MNEYNLFDKTSFAVLTLPDCLVFAARIVGRPRMKSHWSPPETLSRAECYPEGGATVLDSGAFRGRPTSRQVTCQGHAWIHSLMKRQLLVLLSSLVAWSALLSTSAGAQDSVALRRAEELNAEAVQLFRKGQYEEAIPKAREALGIREKALGPEHPDVAQSLNNLAALYRAQGRYGEAEPLHRRALGVREKALGPEHPDVALSLDNLAELYQAQGRFGEAEPLYRRALGIFEKALGPDHPDVATSLNNLAALYRLQGRDAEAEPLYRRALGIFEKALGPDHPDVATSLNNLAELYRAQGRYGEAERLFRRALGIREKALGPEHPDVAQSLNNLARLYRAQGRYGEAEPLYRRALGVREKALGPEHPDVATSLNNLAALYRLQGRYGEAEPLYRRALGIWAKALGPEHPDVALSLDNLAELYQAQGRFGEAEPLHRRALGVREKALGPEHLDVATSLNNLAELYRAQGRYGEAEPLYRRALGIFEKALGPDHPDVATSLNNLAVLYRLQGRDAEAEPLYRRALGIFEKALGPDHPDVAQSLNNLAELYRAQGRYGEAERLFRRALGIREKALGPDHPDVAQSLGNLAELYRAQGRYGEAEPLHRREFGIREKALGPEHPDVATSLNNLAGLYRAQGRFEEAEPLYRRALGIWAKALGPEHPDVATSLDNLAELYQAQGRFGEAEPLHRRALGIREKALGPEHPDVATSLNNLAELYRAQGRYGEAEPLYRRALGISAKALGPEHPDVATSLNNLAELYRAQGRYVDAEPLYRRALGVREKALGPEHPNVATSLNNLAVLYWAQGRDEEAEPLFQRALEYRFKQFEYAFTYMSEKDKLSYLETMVGSFALYFSFCLEYQGTDPGVPGKMYDLVLWEKGLVANSSAALRTAIATGADKESLSLFDQLAAKRRQRASLLRMQPSNREEWRKTVEQLEQDANDMEKELVRRSPALAERKRFTRVTWRDVQKGLGEGEAAVEFVRFPYHDGKDWTPRVAYAALVVTPSMTMPMLSLLWQTRELEAAALGQFRAAVGTSRTTVVSSANPVTTNHLYEVFWKPLEPALDRVDRIYVSPDGILTQIPPGILPTGNGQLLMERYDLHIVSSTKDFLHPGRAFASKVAVLIGDPKFDLSEAQQRAAAARLGTTPISRPELVAVAASGARAREQRGGTLRRLPWTETEVVSIGAALEKAGWQTEVLTGELALKEALERLRGPRVLHLATHGFFLSDQEHAIRRGLSGDLAALPPGAEDPMLRSGLYFAGANRVLGGGSSPTDVYDGVLTAYETTGLNLQGTELVVLSACETGLGDVKNGEGVFGLRRAFQEAGAESVLMSMWSVPDRETQELMTLFYGHWLSGLPKHEALRRAQLRMRDAVRQRYGKDLPYYWGAFVLVGR
jgi:tetratricopeptide (TPR) repeat protein